MRPRKTAKALGLTIPPSVPARPDDKVLDRAESLGAQEIAHDVLKGFAPGRRLGKPDPVRLG
jgi:hypothetical protein